MKKTFLIFVWAVCLSSAFFFLDVILNYFLGYSKSYISGATTEASQAILSTIMLALTSLALYLYTNILTQKQ